MRKSLFIAVILISICLLPLFAAGSKEESDSLETIKARGTLVIATEGNWTPWTYHDAADKLTGFDVELGSLLARSLGVEPEFHEVPWESILVGVEQNVFDIACNGVGYTAERAEKFSFSDPYLYTEAVLVVRSDNTSINSLDDLKGRKTSNSPNSTYAQLAESLGATVDYVDTLGETMMMIEQGRVEATINAKGSVESYLAEHPEAKIKVVQTFAGEPVCYPIRKSAQTESLLAAINGFLSQARADGTLSALSVKYFGVDLSKAD